MNFRLPLYSKIKLPKNKLISLNYRPYMHDLLIQALSRKKNLIYFGTYKLFSYND